jgi:hypothetical protein
MITIRPGKLPMSQAKHQFTSLSFLSTAKIAISSILALSHFSLPAKAEEELTQAPKKVVTITPGKTTVISADTATEDIICTNDLDIARKQRLAFPDSPEASFIYAVALSRTCLVEDALKEVRRARRLAESQGGPQYFDQMIGTYEKMLTYSPEANEVRYHLAWAYYMKAYLLGKYLNSKDKLGQPNYQQWIEQQKTQAASGQTLAQNNSATTQGITDTITPPVVSTATTHPAVLPRINTNSQLNNLPEAARASVNQYYQLALQKLDDLLSRQPDDSWARIYRAHLQVEAGGSLETAMKEWQAVSLANPHNPAPYFFLGEGYLKQGNLRESLANVSKAVALRAVGVQ